MYGVTGGDRTRDNRNHNSGTDVGYKRAGGPFSYYDFSPFMPRKPLYITKSPRQRRRVLRRPCVRVLHQPGDRRDRLLIAEIHLALGLPDRHRVARLAGDIGAGRTQRQLHDVAVHDRGDRPKEFRPGVAIR